jgi:heat shock protein HtpX
MMNGIKTTFLMTLMTVMLVFAGGALGGSSGMMIAFAMSVVMNVGSYWFSDKIVLRMYRAHPVTRADYPVVFDIVTDLTRRGQMPMPAVYVIDDASPNAFATGRNPHHAAVAVTTGIMRLLNREELTGVLAHELAHIRHRDILISTIAATIAGAISMLANMAQWGMLFGGGRSHDREEGGHPIVAILMMILAPIAASLIHMAISRSREFQADAGGARLCGQPLWLASALRKLHAGVQRNPMDASPATAHLFIVSPLIGGGLMSLFSTHPPMEQRIALLEGMAAGK